MWLKIATKPLSIVWHYCDCHTVSMVIAKFSVLPAFFNPSRALENFPHFLSNCKADNNSLVGISKNNRCRDYFYPTELCFWADFNWIKYKTLRLLKVNEMDNGIEWLRSDSSKFIFHYKLENIRSIGEEKKDHNWKVNAPLLSCPNKKQRCDDECLSLSFNSRLFMWGKMAIKSFDRWERIPF